MKKNIKYIILLIVGIIFLGFNAFHGSLWYDESYSMAIIQHGFATIWNDTALDVHPPLYYMMLKVFLMIFGYSITAARIFSVIGALLLASLGFTHLRKLFNDKVGFTFSFLTIFLPVTLGYAIEIRMYTWVAYFVSLTAIYAYKLYLRLNKNVELDSPDKNGNSNKHLNSGTHKSVNKLSLSDRLKNLGKHGNLDLLVPLMIFSILSAYTHYFGLLTVAIINLFLLVYCVKNEKNKKLMIASVIIDAVLYAPWLIWFLFAAARVAFGFWIQVDFNNVLNEILTFVFCAIKANTDMKYTIIIAYPIMFFTIYKIIAFGKYTHASHSDKHKKIHLVTSEKSSRFSLRKKTITIDTGIHYAAQLCLKVLVITMLITLAVSYLRPIFITRYLFPMIGLIIFMIAYAISTIERKRIFISLLTVILLFSIHNFYVEFKKDYDPQNNEVNNYINSQVQPSDIIISADGLMGSSSILFPNNKGYFFNSDEWSIDVCNTYTNMERLPDVSMFSDYHGRVWVITSTDNIDLYNSIDNPNKKMLEESKHFVRPAFEDEFYVYLFEIK
ncbi:MAG: glycosyltransferase family 39 protein [Oscillospiraceae bacterium]|nr:glycosyltransferase family 39 protein [Oscillospiraceae bacterium]